MCRVRLVGGLGRDHREQLHQGTLLGVVRDHRGHPHERIGRAFRAAWRALGLELVAESDAIAANTLSAVRYPAGIDATLLGRVAAEGVVIAGGVATAIALNTEGDPMPGTFGPGTVRGP